MYKERNLNIYIIDIKMYNIHKLLSNYLFWLQNTYISRTLLSVPSSLSRVLWSSSSQSGHSGQYDTVTVSPLRVNGFLPSVESSPLCSHMVHFIRVSFILTGQAHDPRTDSPIRLQESITGALWRVKQNLTGLSFLSQ